MVVKGFQAHDIFSTELVSSATKQKTHDSFAINKLPYNDVQNM